MEALEVKPRFRFAGRIGGLYHWEAVNAEARALMMTPSASTRVSWFWGNLFGMDVVLAAHDRAEELGMSADTYREFVRARTESGRERRALAASMRDLQASVPPITAEEMAEFFPELEPSRARERELDREHLAYLAADVFEEARPRMAAGGVLPPLPAALPASEAIILSPGYYEVPEPVLRRLGRRFLDTLNMTGATR